MPVFPWHCEWLGSGCRIHFKVPSTFCCVIVICPLTAAKLGRRERSLLHIDGYGGLYNPTFFHVTQGVESTVNDPV